MIIHEPTDPVADVIVLANHPKIDKSLRDIYETCTLADLLDRIDFIAAPLIVQECAYMLLREGKSHFISGAERSRQSNARLPSRRVDVLASVALFQRTTAVSRAASTTPPRVHAELISASTAHRQSALEEDDDYLDGVDEDWVLSNRDRDEREVYAGARGRFCLPCD
jgi:hypothetical protein